jgi:diguanylate cyclase (GGDEF)-like protein
MKSDNSRSFQQEGVVGRTLPVVAVGVLGLLLLLQPLLNDTKLTAIVAGSSVAVFALAYVLPWHAFPKWAEALPAFSYLAAVVVLGVLLPNPGGFFVPLLFLPLFWLALHGTRASLLAGLALSTLFVAALALTGEIEATDAQEAFLTLAIATAVCFPVQTLVIQASRQLDQMGELAHTDSLTGIANRREWELQLRRELARAERDGKHLCVALIDLDHFKAFNDRFGHQAGDKLLKEAVAAWREELRMSDLLVRYGGEEFGVLLPGCTLAHAADIIGRLRVHTPSGQTCSAGVTCWDGLESAVELVARADRALYQAKEEGRDRTAVLKSSRRREDLVAFGVKG